MKTLLKALSVLYNEYRSTIVNSIMGSYDGAETCELIGIYMLSLIASKFKDEVGLYLDDVVLRFAKPLRKKLKKPRKKSAMYSNQRA